MQSKLSLQKAVLYEVLQLYGPPNADEVSKGGEVFTKSVYALNSHMTKYRITWTNLII